MCIRDRLYTVHQQFNVQLDSHDTISDHIMSADFPTVFQELHLYRLMFIFKILYLNLIYLIYRSNRFLYTSTGFIFLVTFLMNRLFNECNSLTGISNLSLTWSLTNITILLIFAPTTMNSSTFSIPVSYTHLDVYKRQQFVLLEHIHSL